MKCKYVLFSALLLTCCTKRVPGPNSQDLRPPVEVEIPQSFVSEGKLHVKVSLKPVVNLRAEQVAVDLIAVGNGKESVQKSLVLSSLVSEPILKADVPLVSDFEMDAAGYDEYKVVCRWNEEGISPVLPVSSSEMNVPANKVTPAVAQNLPNIVTGKPREVSRSGKLELENQTLVASECKTSNDICERNYSIKAELKNLTGFNTTDISLALEIKFVPKGEEKVPPMNESLSPLSAEEQEIKLEGLTIPTDENKEIEVKIPEPLVEIPDGHFMPRIRLFKWQKVQ